MKYPCIESTLEFALDGYDFRLWLNESEVKTSVLEYEHTGMVNILEDFWKENGLPRSGKLPEFVEYARKMIPNLNAIQIKERTGLSWSQEGVVVYFVEFNDPVHG